MIMDDRGSVVLLDPESPEEREWLAEQHEGTWFDGALAVDPGHVPPLAEEVQAAGYPLRDRWIAQPWTIRATIVTW
jgi:hypothetical protein